MPIYIHSLHLVKHGFASVVNLCTWVRLVFSVVNHSYNEKATVRLG